MVASREEGGVKKWRLLLHRLEQSEFLLPLMRKELKNGDFSLVGRELKPVASSDLRTSPSRGGRILRFLPFTGMQNFMIPPLQGDAEFYDPSPSRGCRILEPFSSRGGRIL
ncbi:MAG TPA: hypothetical protein VHE58_07435 [Burkholderiales bacterium]|nr:hypothetical protein [Burkholderiales bacterium]